MDLKIAYSPTLALKDSLVAIYKIYVLKNPLTDEIFYVGQTSQELNTRLSGHINETGGSNRAKKEYIKAIVEKGAKPIIEAIETIKGTCYIDKLFVNEREIFWVKYHKSKGTNLLNAALMNNNAECKDFKTYLKSIKEGQGAYRYYYCGRTHGGHKVYDEVKMKLDGFSLPDSPPLPVRVIEKIIFVPAPTIKTLFFPEQLAWTASFASQIPYANLIEDFEEDLSDWEPDSDFEPGSDAEPDIEELDETDDEDDEQEDSESAEINNSQHIL